MYSFLDFKAGYHHTGLSLETPKKSAFMTLMEKFELKNVPSAQVPALFQQLINDVLKGVNERCQFYKSLLR